MLERAAAGKMTHILPEPRGACNWAWDLMRCVYHDGSFHIRVKFCTFTYYWTKKWCWFTPRITEPVRVVEILELSKCRNQGNRFYPQFAFYPRSAVCVLHWPCKLSISSAKYLLYCWVRCLSTLKLWNYPFLVQQCEPAAFSSQPLRLYKRGI